ncbi:uncharacterized protein [Nicotiana tomentosiformis]|uniref:uncharacterized protein n=1 Tax=Nicotiana tomentosiformis TaxID=4098 RepID=UPI00388CB775
MLQAQNSNDHNTSSIRQIYLQLLGELPRVGWKCLVFQNSARPKAVFTMWLLLHGRLPTKDRLANWVLSVTPHCVMCQGQVETREHLFVQCSYAIELWKKIIKWIQGGQMITSCWDQHLQWIIKQGKGKSNKASIFRMIYVETSYALWIERNTRIFEQRYCDSAVLAREIAYICNIRVAARAKNHIQQFTIEE